MMKRGFISFLIHLLFCVIGTHGFQQIDPRPIDFPTKTISVDRYGVMADGETDDSPAFLKAWEEACAVEGDVRIYVPTTTFLLGPVLFKGPCKGRITFHIDATLKAVTDLSRYDPVQATWIQFYGTDGLTVIGGGILDGQGGNSWHQNKCVRNLHKCQVLPSNIKFLNNRNTLFKGLTSLNSKFFHIALVDCHNFKASGLKIIAPDESPNTDGIHIERSTSVSITQTRIATGDDCISLGHGNSDILIKDVTCGPGHGISVGSLGRYHYEQDVRGLVVKSCTITGTSNGVRIKTWSSSPSRTEATNMTFENIVMNNVYNPIIVDQYYCPYVNCKSQGESKVKLSDITFRGIRGTTLSPEAVILHCSGDNPCENVVLDDIHLESPSGEVVSSCKNVEVKYIGRQLPEPCAA